MTRLCLLILCCAAAAAPGGEPEGFGYLPPCQGLVVTAAQAPVRLGGTVIATVPAGRRFSATERKGDLLQVQLASGRNIREGWLSAADVTLLGDADVDLAAEALAIARELDPGLDVAASKALLDALADRVAAAAAPARSPAARIQAINAVLFRDERFRLDPAARTLPDVLAERGGNCLGLSLLYLAAARKLDMPLHMVIVPRHAFVRYDDGRERLNIETVAGGALASDEYVRKAHWRPGGARPKTLSSLEAVGVLLMEAGVVLGGKGKSAEACGLYERAAELAPMQTETYHNWGNALLALKKNALACDRFSRAVQCDPLNAAACYTWGVALASMGESKWACEKFALAVEADPASAGAYYNWGLTLLRMGDRAAGFEKLDRAAALSPAFRAQVDRLRATLR